MEEGFEWLEYVPEISRIVARAMNGDGFADDVRDELVLATPGLDEDGRRGCLKFAMVGLMKISGGGAEEFSFHPAGTDMRSAVMENLRNFGKSGDNGRAVSDLLSQIDGCSRGFFQDMLFRFRSDGDSPLEIECVGVSCMTLLEHSGAGREFLSDAMKPIF